MRAVWWSLCLVAVGCGRSSLYPPSAEVTQVEPAPLPSPTPPVPDGFTRAPPGCIATATPLVPSVFGTGFQSHTGSGASRTIDVTFSCLVSRVSVTALDADFQVSALIAFDSTGRELTRTEFPFDGRPNVLTMDRREVRAPGIARVELQPASADLVAWDQLVAE